MRQARIGLRHYADFFTLVTVKCISRNNWGISWSSGKFSQAKASSQVADSQGCEVKIRIEEP